ncbi:MAG TPA: hypothetical protein VKI17_11135 [Gemmataceae bacterium]|nr:hypothetical protein [Gemmataceae bacterium]
MLRRIFTEEPRFLVPQPPEPELTPQGFVLLVMSVLPCQSATQWSLQQWIYQQAYERAQATVRPSIVERDLLGHWN